MGGVGFPVVVIGWHDACVFVREKKIRRDADEEMSGEPKAKSLWV